MLMASIPKLKTDEDEKKDGPDEEIESISELFPMMRKG